MSSEKEVRQLIAVTDRHYTILQIVLTKVETMMLELEALRAEVKESTTVTEGAVALIAGLSAKLANMAQVGASPQDLAELSAELDKANATLAEALKANTPAEEDPDEPAAVDVLPEPELKAPSE